MVAQGWIQRKILVNNGKQKGRVPDVFKSVLWFCNTLIVCDKMSEIIEKNTALSVCLHWYRESLRRQTDSSLYFSHSLPSLLLILLLS